MEWVLLLEAVATVGIFLIAILVGLRDRPATVNILKNKQGGHRLIVLTKKGKVFSQHNGPYLPADFDADKHRKEHVIGQWDEMHSIPRRKGVKGWLLGQFDEG